MKKGLLLVSILVMVAILGGMLASCAQPAAKPAAPAAPAAPAEPKLLKIGVTVPLSGPVAAVGDLYKKTLEIYAEIINARGVKAGADTYKVEFVLADDQYNPQVGVAAMNKLIFSDKVSIVFSPSPMNSAVSPLTNANKVIYWNRNANGFTGYDAKTMPYNFYQSLTESPAHIFYTAFNANPGIKTVGSLWAIGNKGTVDNLIARLKNFSEKNGAKFLEPEYYPIGTQDFTPYLSKMNGGDLDILFISGPATDLLTVAKQRYAQGKKYPLVNPAEITNLKAFIAAVGPEALEGVVSQYDLPTAFQKTKISPQHLADAEKFQAMWLEKYKIPITDISTQPWGWIMMPPSAIFDGIQQAGSIDPDVLAKTMRGGTLESCEGKFTMTGTKLYGGPVFYGNPCMASVIKGGKEVYLGEFPLTDVDNLP